MQMRDSGRAKQHPKKRDLATFHYKVHNFRRYSQELGYTANTQSKTATKCIVLSTKKKKKDDSDIFFLNGLQFNGFVHLRASGKWRENKKGKEREENEKEWRRSREHLNWYKKDKNIQCELFPALLGLHSADNKTFGIDSYRVAYS